MEKENRVETTIIRYFCDDEGCEGIAEYVDGKILMSNPPKFEHKCNKCGKKYRFTHKYPYTKYEIIE